MQIYKGGIITESSAAPYALKVGTDATKPTPRVGDTYFAYDTGVLYSCFTNAVWSLMGSTLSSFNLLKMYTTNIFTQTIAGTGSIASDLAAGTLMLSIPANNDDAIAVEKDQIVSTLLPRIMVFRIDSLNIIPGAATYCRIGLSDGTPDAFAGIWTTDGGTNWAFFTQQGVAQESTAIAAPAANDLYILYLTAARAVFFKNGAHLATHTATLPTDPISHYMELASAGAEGAGNWIKLGYMS